ncbi:hypothetical protein [Parerythrobacter aestuarii]|uniref:hypothetical protein n=1 Tax=Parerythrobacter aestuarii TaxID=3020909 RepID=UPI0024DE2121|nr:hypothetical protein [Parerythrobacter aestuarii]
MSWKNEVRELFAAHKQARDTLIEISKSQEEGWQTKYGRIRGELRNSLDALETAVDRQRRLHSEPVIDRYHDAIVAFRKVLENHHARWPVLIIKDRGPDYQESMKAVDAGFTEVMRQTENL